MGIPRRVYTAATIAVLVASSLAYSNEPPRVRINPDEGTVSIGAGDPPAVLYQFEQNPCKPYLKELRTPGGLNLLLDSPSDHIHHHALMFALGVDDIDFWAEGGDRIGIQTSRRLSKRGTPGRTGFVQEITWDRSKDRTMIHETREIHLLSGADITSTLLTWRSTLGMFGESAQVTLRGDHYFGLGMRFVREMDNNCAFLHAGGGTGHVFRGDERLTPAAWCACRSTVDGRPVTAAIFDHPLNPRYPALFFTMASPFAYLSATMNLHVLPRTLLGSLAGGRPPALPQETLDLCYGVAAFDGHVPSEVIQETYLKWLFLEDPFAQHTNVALSRWGTQASASSEYGPGYVAGKAIDGNYRVRETDKWNSKAGIAPHYLRLDLGCPRTLEAAVIRHEGALPLPDAFQYNTADYRLQGSNKPWGPWAELIPPVRENTDNVTLHRFAPVTLRYVRLLIETGEQGGANAYGRIAELELYAPDSTLSIKEGMQEGMEDKKQDP